MVEIILIASAIVISLIAVACVLFVIYRYYFGNQRSRYTYNTIWFKRSVVAYSVGEARHRLQDISDSEGNNIRIEVDFIERGQFNE